MREMRKFFNVTGACFPEDHYMVNLDKRLSEIKEMVDRGDYFVINRGRQYGKTTTLFALAEYLKKNYVVAPLDFQQMSSTLFATEQSFVTAFVRFFSKVLVEANEVKFLDENTFKNFSGDNPPLDLAVLFERLS